MISNTKFTQELEFYSEMIGCFISEIRAWYNLFFFHWNDKPPEKENNYSDKIIRFHKQNYTNVINKNNKKTLYKSKWLWPWQRYTTLYKQIL